MVSFVVYVVEAQEQKTHVRDAYSFKNRKENILKFPLILFLRWMAVWRFKSYGNSIEGALCAYDMENGQKLKDSDAIRFLKFL